LSKNNYSQKKGQYVYKQSDTKQLYFQGLGPRKVVADFGGGTLSSDGGGLLLREVDLRERFVDELAKCFSDGRDQRYVEHSLRQMVAQRLYALALGYEDLNDHDQLRYDPLFAALCQSEDPQGKGRRRERDVGKALSNSTSLGRMERVGSAPDRYHKIGCCKQKMREFFVSHFLRYYNGGKAPKRIVIDVEATDDEVHGRQQGRFFHGYFDCYCYLPLYVFCGNHLLAAVLRSSNIDASAGTDEELEPIVEQIRERWPRTQIIIRGDS
jgi:hypothetical protein